MTSGEKALFEKVFILSFFQKLSVKPLRENLKYLNNFLSSFNNSIHAKLLINKKKIAKEEKLLSLIKKQ